MFCYKLKNKSKSDRVNNPGKSIPFSDLPKKVLDGKPLKISTVLNEPIDFIEINLKVLMPVQPFVRPKSCILQGLSPGQSIENAGNNQNTILLDMCFDTIQKYHHFAPYQKPFVFYHIKHTYQSDVLFIPFSFDDSFAPTNRIYPTCCLLFFVGVLRCPFEPWPVAGNDNQPLTFDGIEDISNNDYVQMTSKNDRKGINLIYGPTFDKQFHSLSTTNHSLSIIFNHFLMTRNDKFYLHILSICTYIILGICIYNIRFYGFKPDKAKRMGLGRILPSQYVYIIN